MNNLTDITKRYNHNLPLLKKLALVDVPNLYGLFNNLIHDFCKGKKLCQNILENNPYCYLSMFYDNFMCIDNIKYVVSFYEENISIEVNALNIIVKRKFIDDVKEVILDIDFERFYELYVKKCSCKRIKYISKICILKIILICAVQN